MVETNYNETSVQHCEALLKLKPMAAKPEIMLVGAFAVDTNDA